MLDDLKKTLWATADKLRANMDAAEYKHLVLGLSTAKPISDTFVATGAEPTARLSNPVDAYYCGHAAPEGIEPELEDRDDYAEVNALWVPEAGQLRLLEAKALLEEACA
jgi:type I restriction enzyme M protein